MKRKINQLGEWWWEGRRKKPTKKTVESGGTKINRTIQPTQTLGVEITPAV